MKCLTICQPWAWAIAAGHKRFENRTWTTRYRGPLAIHAGLSRRWLAEGNAFLRSLGITPPGGQAATADLQPPLIFGAVIAVAELVDVHDAADVDDPFAFGPYCWELADVRQIDPVAATGRLNLFEVELPANCLS